MLRKLRTCPLFLHLFSAGLCAFLPFQDFLDPLALLERVHPTTHLEQRWKTTYDHPLAKDEISFRWLGTTGFKVQKGDFVLLIDPYLTRVSFPQIYFGPLVPNEKILKEKIPKADYIFITDSHFDHFLDAPAIALRTGAKVVGSSTVAKLLRVLKVPENQIVEVQGGEMLQAGPFSVQVAKATHGSIWFFKLWHHDVDVSCKPPLKVGDYGNLENRAYRFSADGFSFFATSGSDLDESALKDFRSDLVMANVTTLPPGYVEKLMRITSPKTIFPTHYDNFFRPFSDGVKPFLIADLKIFCRQLRKCSPATLPVTFDFFQEYRARLPQAPSSEKN